MISRALRRSTGGAKPKAGALAPPGMRQERDQNALAVAERLFVLEYVANGWNGVKAYLASHPNCKSYNAAGVQAHRLLKTPKIRAALQAEMAASFKRLEMDGDEAIALLSLSARADIGDAFDEQGKLLPVYQWPESLRLAVKSVKPGPFGDTITLHDGLKARELMAMIQSRLRSGMDLNLNFDHEVHLAVIERRRLEALQLKKTVT